MRPLSKAAWLCSLSATLAILAMCGAAYAQAQTSWQLNYASDKAAQALKPSVVFIETRFDQPRNDTEYAIWSYLRGARPLYGLYGGGFIYKDPKYVITTPFILSHAAYIRVITSDGHAFSAKKVGEDGTFQTAVLEVDWGHQYVPTPAPLADSDNLMLGEPICITGYGERGRDYSSTVGVISAIRKELPGVDEPTEQYIQFDAAYQLSMMGGPLSNTNGEVVGIVYNTVLDFNQSNINLAVPVNDVARVADRIIAGKAKRPWFGVETILLTDQIRMLNKVPGRIANGMFITYVDPGSPADLAGLKAGDIILALDGKVIQYQFDYSAFFRRIEVDQIINVNYWRFTAGISDDPKAKGGDTYDTVVQILEYPEGKD
jgi:S1-C subfamily serine protease